MLCMGKLTYFREAYWDQEDRLLDSEHGMKACGTAAAAAAAVDRSVTGIM
jgi:hypothetical protein